MLCEACVVPSTVFLVHYFFMLALTLMLREWKRWYACVLSSLSALCHLMGVFGIMYKIFFMFWSVCLPPRVCINTHTHTHTQETWHIETWRIKLWFYYTVLLEGQIGITLLHIWVHLTRAEELLRSSVWVFSRDLSFQSSEQLHTPNSQQQYHDLGIISSFFSLLALTIKGFC